MNTEDRIAALEEANFKLHGQLFQLRAHVKATMEVLCVLGVQAGADQKTFREALVSRARSNLDSALIQVEQKDPALAARIDLREIDDVF